MKTEITVNHYLVLDGQLLACIGERFICGRIVSITDKAIKIDYDNSSVWSQGKTVYSKTAWIPRSALTTDPSSGLTIKNWFLNKMQGKHIKPYIIINNEINYV